MNYPILPSHPALRELQGYVSQILIYRKFNNASVQDELSEVLWPVDCISDRPSIDLETALRSKQEKISIGHGNNKFSYGSRLI